MRITKEALAARSMAMVDTGEAFEIIFEGHNENLRQAAGAVTAALDLKDRTADALWDEIMVAAQRAVLMDIISQ